MKAGTLILVIILMVFAFGFVLKDDIETHEGIAVLEKQVNELNRQLEETRSLLDACLNEKERDEQTIEELRKVVETQKAMIEELNKQIAELTFQNSMLESRKAILDFIEQNPYLLVGALLTQMTTSAFNLKKKIGLKSLGRTPASQDEYMRVSKEELAHIVSRRRNRK